MRLSPALLRSCGLALAILVLGVYGSGLISLYRHSQDPLDGVLVLGGSIRREMYVAELSPPDLPRPILISGGSPGVCVRYLFDRAQRSSDQVWIEPCAKSTFDNFRFALPFFQRQGSHHLLLVSSGNHMQRATPLGQLMLGFHGIALTPYSVPEIGRPGNHESFLKTVLDLTRGFFWGLLTRWWTPGPCTQIVPLETIPSATVVPPHVACEAPAKIPKAQ